MAQLLDLDESSDEQIPTIRTFKVTIVGDGSVGKSSICNRFAKDFFASSYKQTIGIDFFSQMVTLDDGSRVTFYLYDIGGQSIGSKMLPTYISGTDAFIFVYDLTNADSLENILEWYRMVKSSVKSLESVVIYLVGNKSDLASLRAVRSARSNEIATAINASAHLILSARTGDRVGLLFISLAGCLCEVDVTAMVLDSTAAPVVRMNKDTEETVSGINFERFLGDVSRADGAAALEQAKQQEKDAAEKVMELEGQFLHGSGDSIAKVEKARRSGRCAIM